MHRLRKAGQFPAPVPLTRGRIVWLREKLDNWLDDRAGSVSDDGLAWPDA